MGRKKKRVEKPWCWYCNREFDDEKILTQHQKAKHFKCHMCHKRLFSGPGLAIHCMQVHKETIDKIPGSLPGRESTDIEIYGMQGIPDDAVRGIEYEEGVAGKRLRIEPNSNSGSGGAIPMPPMMPPGMPPGMPFGMPPGMPPPFGMPPGMPPHFPQMPGMPPMPPPFMPPGYTGPPGAGARGGPPPPWGGSGGPMGPPPPGFPPRMMPPHMGGGGGGPPMHGGGGPAGGGAGAQITGHSTVPQSYSERLAAERSERAPIPDAPLNIAARPSEGVSAFGSPKDIKPVPAQLTAKIRIVHPDDHNISLEERRLEMISQRASSAAAGYSSGY